jgi:hypothetical protein
MSTELIFIIILSVALIYTNARISYVRDLWTTRLKNVVGQIGSDVEETLKKTVKDVSETLERSIEQDEDNWMIDLRRFAIENCKEKYSPDEIISFIATGNINHKSYKKYKAYVKPDPLAILREDTFSNDEINQQAGQNVRKEYCKNQKNVVFKAGDCVVLRTKYHDLTGVLKDDSDGTDFWFDYGVDFKHIAKIKDEGKTIRPEHRQDIDIIRIASHLEVAYMLDIMSSKSYHVQGDCCAKTIKPTNEA